MTALIRRYLYAHGIMMMSHPQVAIDRSRLLASPLTARFRLYRQILQRFRAEGMNPYALALGRSCFSQFGEDQFLAERFAGKPDGFYVDVGAFHPFTYSNTCLLYQRGWRGINIEPDPKAIELFNRHRPRDLNLQVAIASTTGEARFACLAEFAGIEDDAYLWRDRDGERITVTTQPLAALLDQHLPAGQPIDLLDVDCEGRDFEVLQSNDWHMFRPSVVLAEAHCREDDSQLTAFMDSVGYRRAIQYHLTLVYVER